jgi:Flp pilus assembly protein TadB
MLEILLVLTVVAVFVLFIGVTMPAKTMKREIDLTVASSRQYRPRTVGNSKLLGGLTNSSMRRAMRDDGVNARYLRQLKQANWYWAPGEPTMPSSRVPFWNLETLWGEKIIGALVYTGAIAVIVLLVGLFAAYVAQLPLMIFVIAALLIGGVAGLLAYSSPDQALQSAAVRRQRELSLEMGYRIPELRSDVLAGNTIQRAMRNMSRRPGGPFVEELRRAVIVLDVTKDDTLAMDQLIDRSSGNELVIEFANSIKMTSRQGGQIGPVLNVLADLAQQRLRLQIESQARRNLMEMTRPIGIGSLVITTFLIIAPAIAGVLSSLGNMR